MCVHIFMYEFPLSLSLSVSLNRFPLSLYVCVSVSRPICLSAYLSAVHLFLSLSLSISVSLAISHLLRRMCRWDVHFSALGKGKEKKDKVKMEDALALQRAGIRKERVYDD